MPKDYSGPTVVNAGSSGGVEPQKADLFYLYKIDDKSIDNIAYKTEQTGKHSGFSLKLYTVERQVQIQPMKVFLAGQTYCAAPIGELFNEVYSVSGAVDFTPNAGEKYVVHGVLGKDYSAVWIETEGGRVVTRNVKKRG
ncbi:MAG: hypothetical protein GY789_09830 [Hyphomicrobiales bacterium]|nr:hypothetical protein [Hyphomicrobiales bacterium]MCP5000769.1 hypothetical protein [Hyphomicrobiales bacterium]